MAYPNKAVEIAGPVRGNIRHAQYNTPCCMYSDAQIANTLISQAAAIGADVPGTVDYFDYQEKYSLDSILQFRFINWLKIPARLELTRSKSTHQLQFIK